jgi:hypothetical protein
MPFVNLRLAKMGGALLESTVSEDKMKELLINYTIEIVRVLIKLFECKKIGLTVFKHNIQCKLLLLENICQEMSDCQLTQKAEEIILRCHQILAS